jgi:hypothetical protein
MVYFATASPTGMRNAEVTMHITRILGTCTALALGAVASCNTATLKPVTPTTLKMSILKTSSGPRINLCGGGFWPNSQIDVGYINVPSSTPNRTGTTGTANTNGDFNFVDNTMYGDWNYPKVSCSSAQMAQSVTVRVSNKQSGIFIFGSLPAYNWCPNSSKSGGDYGGGCHPQWSGD